MAERFLTRWARRKTESQLEHDAAPAADVPGAAEEIGDGPSMQDAQLLTPDSDFSRFIARNVNPDVRRAALKKLFSDPHFQQMDGLDIYIDDYTRPSPLPPEMLAALWHAKSTLSPKPLYRVEPEQTAETPPALETDEPAGPGTPDSEEEALPQASEAGSSDEPESEPGDAPSPEGTRLPFNEHVNFSNGSESH